MESGKAACTWYERESINSRVTGRYVKFSLRLTLAVFESLSGFTLFTRKPPGLRLDGIQSMRRWFTVSVSESFEGCSGGGVCAFTTRRDFLRVVLFLRFVYFLEFLFFELLDFLDTVWVVFAFERFFAAWDSTESNPARTITAAIIMYKNLLNFISKLWLYQLPTLPNRGRDN